MKPTVVCGRAVETLPKLKADALYVELGIIFLDT